MVIFADEVESKALHDLFPNQMPISQYLNYIDWYLLLQYLEENCYCRGENHFRYNPLLMLKLVVVKCFRRLSCRDTIASLSEEDCRNQGLSKTEDGYPLPAHSTLHHFVKYRLKSEANLIFPRDCRDRARSLTNLVAYCMPKEG